MRYTVAIKPGTWTAKQLDEGRASTFVQLRRSLPFDLIQVDYAAMFGILARNQGGSG
jgi:hypothetical protein